MSTNNDIQFKIIDTQYKIIDIPIKLRIPSITYLPYPPLSPQIASPKLTKIEKQLILSNIYLKKIYKSLSDYYINIYVYIDNNNLYISPFIDPSHLLFNEWNYNSKMERYMKKIFQNINKFEINKKTILLTTTSNKSFRIIFFSYTEQDRNYDDNHIHINMMSVYLKKIVACEIMWLLYPH